MADNTSMSNYKGYKAEDNAKRKSNNTSDELGWGSNNNVKAYSSKPGQLSAKDEAAYKAKLMKKLNKSQPVKLFSPEEKALMEKALGLK